jgi:cell division protein FtsZ
VFLIEPETDNLVNIKIVGVGGGGCNAVDRMMAAGLTGVEFIAVNTDAQALLTAKAATRLQIGARLTKGHGAGADADMGEKAALESRDQISRALAGAAMVFVAAGMGGGTGTGAAPVIAECAREAGALTVGVVTKPFTFEGKVRMRRAEAGIEKMKSKADTLITIRNDRLLQAADRHMTVPAAFALTDVMLCQGVQGVSDLIKIPGLINLDFADIRKVMENAGAAVIGMGAANGNNGAVAAVEAALNRSIMDTSICGARNVLLNFTGGKNLCLFDVNEAASIITGVADKDANVIFGAAISEELEEDEVRVTVIVTGLEEKKPPAPEKKREGIAWIKMTKQPDAPRWPNIADDYVPSWVSAGNGQALALLGK